MFSYHYNGKKLNSLFETLPEVPRAGKEYKLTVQVKNETLDYLEPKNPKFWRLNEKTHEYDIPEPDITITKLPGILRPNAVGNMEITIKPAKERTSPFDIRWGFEDVYSWPATLVIK